MMSTQTGAGASSSKLEQALNEEGLPFVDLNEPLNVQDDLGETKGKGVVLPFAPSRTSREDRRAWLEATLGSIEAEDGDENAMVGNDLPPTVSDSLQSPSKHNRVASADRPAPIRSVLKQTASGTSTPQRFGASGMRKGFLNMNPSSPAAEHSSDPIDKIMWASDEPMSASTSSLGSVGDYMRSNGSGTDDVRSTRDAKHPPSTAKARKKKTVRIQSPERRTEPPTSIRNRTQDAQRRPDEILDRDEESNEAEAKMIVDLLGVEAIRGHPQYEVIKADIERRQNFAVATTSATTTPARQRASAKPAVRENVVERESKAQNARPSLTASRGVWKRGFLRELPPPPSVPQGPQRSQGISALERASIADEDVLRQQERRGGKAMLPHARPSKAFAARLQARKEGLDVDAIEEGIAASASSKVRFEEDSKGELAISIGEAATEARPNSRTSDVAIEETVIDGDSEGIDVRMNEAGSGDDQMAVMGLEVHDEYLDDDQIEALGYFSDEDADPDIGFDSDDLVEAYPHFESEAADILDINLREEYEKIKAKLQRTTGPGASMSERYSTEDIDIGLADNGLAKPATSRFKQEKVHRLLANRPATSRELGSTDKKASAQNAGPSMIIPTLADIRYPKPLDDGTIPTKAHEIELDGRSDEEDDLLEDVMRTRLADMSIHLEGEARSGKEMQEQPPSVVAAAKQKEQAPDGKTRKKPSLFKSRLQRDVEND